MYIFKNGGDRFIITNTTDFNFKDETLFNNVVVSESGTDLVLSAPNDPTPVDKTYAYASIQTPSSGSLTELVSILKGWVFNYMNRIVELPSSGSDGILPFTDILENRAGTLYFDGNPISGGGGNLPSGNLDGNITIYDGSNWVVGSRVFFQETASNNAFIGLDSGGTYDPYNNIYICYNNEFYVSDPSDSSYISMYDPGTGGITIQSTSPNASYNGWDCYAGGVNSGITFTGTGVIVSGVTGDSKNVTIYAEEGVAINCGNPNYIELGGSTFISNALIFGVQNSGTGDNIILYDENNTLLELGESNNTTTNINGVDITISAPSSLNLNTSNSGYIKVDGQFVLRAVGRVAGTSTTVLPYDTVNLCETSTPGTTCTLSNSGDVQLGAIFKFVDIDGNAGTFPITINAGVGHTINGGASTTITTNFGSATLLKVGTTSWVVI